MVCKFDACGNLIDMDKKHIITISGKPGSGKSSTADKVAELLSYTRYSAGDIVRKLVRDKGMTLEEFNKQAGQNPETDHLIDEELRKLRNAKNVIVDSRLGFYWIPESFKVYLDLDDDIATARIFKDTVSNQARSTEASSSTSIEEVSRLVHERMNAERQRFLDLYGTDPYNSRNFDLIVNTSRHSPQTVALAIFDNYHKWLKSDDWRQVVSEVPLGYSLKNDF